MLRQERNAECARLLSGLLTGTVEGVVTDFSIYGIALKIESDRNEPRVIAQWLASLSAYKGLRIHSFLLEEKILATGLMEQYALDFDDALQVQGALSNGISEIVSFDSDFDKVKEIKRVEPKDILARTTEG